MIRQMKYFQSIVRNNSFSEAAEECHISQSAISQQLQALERELGFQLLERKNRKFSLTPAGEHFYQKSIILVADYEQLCRETAKIARDDKAVLRVGYLRSYNGGEFHQALEEFARKYPEVTVQIEHGNHEELYHLLISGQIDIAFNDQRRKFFDAYVNLILETTHSSIEISSASPLAALSKITPQELKNIPCILVTSPSQQETEREYYHNAVGFQGEFIFAENLEAARLLVISGKGFLPIEGNGQIMNFGTSITRIPLFQNGKQITRNYCAFWKKDNSGYYVEEFADILKSKFEK
ncbi:MAG: LysR family transcriptional regulator [Lachnospiraceae bacterium]|jgi:DNA-binding transcriptional LysR family regulator|nr:LysR family transcriptional regulator [Lachnospiraceae bacterium]MCI9326875.1 LysR family transcriptional regulator [Lachnospiraceae bacterium]